MISEKDKSLLGMNFEVKEIVQALGKIKKNGTPGPDNINSNLYLSKNCMIIKFICELMNSIGVLDQGNNNFSRLNGVKIIPIAKECKNDKVTSIHDIRPIGLMNFDCKLMSRVLLDRIVPVISKILPEESTAIRNRGIGRAIWDHYMVFKLRKHMYKKEAYIIRIDMKKAYSMCNNDYLIYLMHKYLGNNITVKAIENIICQKQLMIEVGDYTTNFKNLKGSLIQGSPLSGDLFNLYLIDLIKVIKHNVRGISLDHGFGVKKLSVYIDDLSVFASSKQDIGNVVNILRDFQELTGSEINFNKSYIYDIVNDKVINHTTFKGSHGKILGINFSGGRLATDRITLQEKIDEIRTMLQKWKDCNVGILRKTQIINKLILSKLNYFLVTEKLTQKWIRSVVSICQKFIFGKCIYLSGVKMSYPQERGGIGLMDIRCLAISIKVNNFKKYFISNKLNHDNNINYLEKSRSPVLREASILYYEYIKKLGSETKISHKTIRNNNMENSDEFKTYRNKDISTKDIVNLHLEDGIEDFGIKWRLQILPSKAWLAHRNVLRGIGPECDLCLDVIETQSHILIECISISDFVNKELTNLVGLNKLQKALEGLGAGNYSIFKKCQRKRVMCMMFACWKKRNYRIFKNKDLNVKDTYNYLVHREFFGDIRSQNSYWIDQFWNLNCLQKMLFVDGKYLCH